MTGKNKETSALFKLLIQEQEFIKGLKESIKEVDNLKRAIKELNAEGGKVKPPKIDTSNLNNASSSADKLGKSYINLSKDINAVTMQTQAFYKANTATTISIQSIQETVERLNPYLV